MLMTRANHGQFRCGKTALLPFGRIRPFSVVGVPAIGLPNVDRTPKLAQPDSILSAALLGAPVLTRTGPVAPTTWTFTYFSLYSTQSGTTQAALSDGDIQAGASTYGSNISASEFLKADFGATRFVTNVRLRAIGNSAPGGWGSVYTNGLLLQRSTDNTNWTTIATTSGHTDDEATPRTYSVNQEARYIRLATAASAYMGLGDFFFN